MFQKESCHPRDTSTLLLNSNKIPPRLANLKLLVAATFSLLTLGKKTLTSGHPLQAVQYVGAVLAAGVWTQGAKVELSKFLIMVQTFAEHHVSISFLLESKVQGSAYHGIKEKEEAIVGARFGFADIHADSVAEFAVDEDSAEV